MHIRGEIGFDISVFARRLFEITMLFTRISDRQGKASRSIASMGKIAVSFFI